MGAIDVKERCEVVGYFRGEVEMHAVNRLSSVEVRDGCKVTC